MKYRKASADISMLISGVWYNRSKRHRISLEKHGVALAVLEAGSLLGRVWMKSRPKAEMGFHIDVG